MPSQKRGRERPTPETRYETIVDTRAAQDMVLQALADGIADMDTPIPCQIDNALRCRTEMADGSTCHRLPRANFGATILIGCEYMHRMVEVSIPTELPTRVVSAPVHPRVG